MTASEVVQDVLWTEKYRPEKLEDLALEDENRRVLESYIAEGIIPHLLLIGPPGSGKTTMARILLRELDCQALTLNASSERGIETVRSKIGSFVTSMLGAAWNIVFLDEFDQMTTDAQTALRNTIESYADRSRFLLTGNYPHRIIPAIASRCQTLTFGRPPLKERVRILLKVLAEEGIETQPTIALGYAERFPDIRAMLFAAQRAFLGSADNDDDRVLPPAVTSGQVTGVELFQFLTQKNWTKFKSLTTSGDFEVQQALRELFWAVPDDHQKAGFLRHVFGRGVHETGFTPDPIILFLGVVAEAMEGL